MVREDVYRAVVDALNAIQLASGRRGVEIKGSTKPIGGIAEFDSHAGLELTCELEVVLKIKVPLDENLCVDDVEDRARTVDEIVARVYDIQKGN